MTGLAWFNALPDPDADGALARCCSSPAWVVGVRTGRPYGSVAELVATSTRLVAGLTPSDLRSALDGHPRIGEREVGSPVTWSSQEQARMAAADEALAARMRTANEAYEARFGHVYLVRAAGRSASELVELAETRLHHDPADEDLVVREELSGINGLRLTRLLEEAAP